MLKQYPEITIDGLQPFENFLLFWKTANLRLIFEKFPEITIDSLLLFRDFLLQWDIENLKLMLKQYPEITIDGLQPFHDFLLLWKIEKLRLIFEEFPKTTVDDLVKLEDVFRYSQMETLSFWLDYIPTVKEAQDYKSVLCFSFPDNFWENLQFKENDHAWYLQYINAIAKTEYKFFKKQKMIEKIVSLSFNEAENYLEVFQMLDDSISMDVQRVKNELIDQILEADNPREVAEKILNIFEKNNLPLTWKIFKVFELLYPKENFIATLREHWSPVLHDRLAKNRNVYSLIYKDLMNIAIKSGDRSLKQYLNTFIWSEEVLKKFEWIVSNDSFNFDDKLCLEGKLTEWEQERLLYLFRRIWVLYDRYYGGEINEWDDIEELHLWKSKVSDDELVEMYLDIKKWFHLKKWESIYDRLQRFLRWLWYKTFQEVLDGMNKEKEEAHQRWLKLVNEADWGKIAFPEKTFLKWVYFDAFSKLLERGITCKEYLWGWDDGTTRSWADSDWTPFDSDWWYTDSFYEWWYWNIKLVVDTKTGNFYDSRKNWLEWYDDSKYELFKTWVIEEHHYGIRTWIPATEIDYIIYTWDFDWREFEDMCYQIARNGYYIPITDKDWNIKFTPEMYHKIRLWFNYMDYYDGFDIQKQHWIYETKEHDNKVYKAEPNSELWKLIKANSPKNERFIDCAKENAEMAKDAYSKILYILQEKCWITFNSKYDTSILWAQLYDSGSTWRWTDIPTKDVDLDFTLLLDANDYKRVWELKKIIEKEIDHQESGDEHSTSSEYQMKSKVNNIGKSEERPNWVRLDLLFLKKNQVIDYSSSDAMKEKLHFIAKNLDSWDKDLEWVRTNIIIMKKLLKAKSCYKKLEKEWWMWWIGVENWITQNHWNIIEALESFEEVAYNWKYEEWRHPIPLNEFKHKYPIFDAGQNYKEWKIDNFVSKINDHGYKWILEIIKSYKINWIKWLEEIIKEYEENKAEFIQ